MKLPYFQRTGDQRKWVSDEIRTARFIHALWKAAAKTQRRDAAFIALLVQCGWTNAGRGTGRDSTRKWRHQRIAQYLGVPYGSDTQLAGEMSRKFPALTEPSALLRSHTGITRYYASFRRATIVFVYKNASTIANAFEQVAAKRKPGIETLRRVVDSITRLGEVLANGRKISPLNGLTPTLACLDPHRKFPIMNSRTKRLLRVVGERQDPAGAIALSKLIGLYGVKNSFELDVYSQTEDFSKVKPPPKPAQEQFRDVGLRSEVTSLARIVKNRVKIRKLHNRLTNRLHDYLLWRRIVAKESQFDALVRNWKPGRDLLIEAKTSASGSTGRAQIRQAIGQLLDYRFSYFRAREKVDLAVLLPARPPNHVRSLLSSLGIEVLSFEGRKLTGSVSL